MMKSICSNIPRHCVTIDIIILIKYYLMKLSLLLSLLPTLLVSSLLIKNAKTSALKSNLLSIKQPAIMRPLQLVPSDILVDANFNLAAGSLVVGTICGVLENFKGITARLFGAGAIAFTLFGGFLTFQTSTLRFKFSEDSFALVKSDGSSIGENVVVGGENSWNYKSFVNYDFLPR